MRLPSVAEPKAAISRLTPATRATASRGSKRGTPRPAPPVYQGTLYVTGSMENYYDKFLGPADDTVDWFGVNAGVVVAGSDGIADNLQPIDVNMDGVIDFTNKVDGNGDPTAGVYVYGPDDKEITFH